MSKWSLALAVGIVVIAGCSGGGGGGGPTPPTPSNPNDSTAFITLPGGDGILQSVYLTGQGRAEGDLLAVIRNDSQHDVFGTVASQLERDVRLDLTAYTSNQLYLTVPVSTFPDLVRTFTQYRLNIDHTGQENADGTSNDFPPDSSGVLQDFDAFYRLFPGRMTSVTVRLNDSMFTLTNQSSTFDSTEFQNQNYSTSHGHTGMNGFLSDYLMFDLSGSANNGHRPQLPDASGEAGQLYVSGDNFAVSVHSDGPQDQATTDPKPYFIFTENNTTYLEGKHIGERTRVDPGGSPQIFPGTYTMIQPDPRPLANPNARLTALVGGYRLFSARFGSLGTNPQNFEILAFPGTYTDDEGTMQVLLFNYSGGGVSNVYYGTIDLGAGTIIADPIENLGIVPLSGSITGTVNQFTGTNGAVLSNQLAFGSVRGGRFTLSGAPGSFSTSGRFVVFRK